MPSNETKKSANHIPRWGIFGGVAIILATAIAAPFYKQTAETLLWVGETLKTLCGW
jgi:hypothetical protein